MHGHNNNLCMCLILVDWARPLLPVNSSYITTSITRDVFAWIRPFNFISFIFIYIFFSAVVMTLLHTLTIVAILRLSCLEDNTHHQAQKQAKQQLRVPPSTHTSKTVFVSFCYCFSSCHVFHSLLKTAFLPVASSFNL